ncbi:MAG: PEP/pyruvate-binding domain-containing protein [Desulfosarcina sp.]
MKAVLSFSEIKTRHRRLVGGKALKLAMMQQKGVRVPDGLCVTTTAYDDFVRSTGLNTRIGLELGRLPLADRRWEEIWDMALRIRNRFLKTPLPEPLRKRLTAAIEGRFGERAVAVRSSSPQEDRKGSSFAGLHESYVNVRGADPILTHIRLVWASLWSDGALIYRKELGLNMQKAAMAVIVQELVEGQCSGVAFSMSPDGADHGVVESVYGLNQGLVDGTIPPDRWTVDRRTGRGLSHTPAVREQALRSTANGVETVSLTQTEKDRSPLNEQSLERVFRLAMSLERHFKQPQDVEWTFSGGTLFLLQSRPVTTARNGSNDDAPWSVDDKRPWYLSLKRSFDNLMVLHRRIEEELLPQMADEVQSLSTVDLTGLSDRQLIEAIEKRVRIHQRWVDVYWRDFIPFAHGARLFGQIYNDLVKPDDPYAFTALLGETRMTGMARNRDLQALAHVIRSDNRLREQLAAGVAGDLNPEFIERLNDFLHHYEDLTFKAVRFFTDREGLIRLLLEMAGQAEPARLAHRPEIAALIDDFISRFPEERHDFARQILEIGRSSYRLRDNDNIELARIEAQLIKAVDEGKRRIGKSNQLKVDALTPAQVVDLLSDPAVAAVIVREQEIIDEPVQHHGRPNLDPTSVITAEGSFVMRARQIVGQPAGRGLAVGTARVISSVDDLFQFKSGEILVCDAIDPNMTFVVPLAAAIVERRGGMLVHGAIIAREYGLPCVTGVADAAALIHTGDRLTVDGYLGIVTIDA